MRPENSLRFAALSLALFGTGCATAYAEGTALPANVSFGASLEAMTPVFDRLCDDRDVRTLDPADLPVAETSHVQVDCRGFDHAGAERLAEFVFADDSLVFIWVLTDAAEEATHLAALRAAHGTPTHDTPVFVAFADNNVALRRDEPEFLYYGDAVAPMYRAWFDQMTSQ